METESSHEKSRLNAIELKVKDVQGKLQTRLPAKYKNLVAMVCGAKWRSRTFKPKNAASVIKKIRLELGAFDYSVKEQAELLTRYLIELDGVLSYGNSEIRRARKALVILVQQLLPLADEFMARGAKLKHFGQRVLGGIECLPTTALKPIDSNADFGDMRFEPLARESEHIESMLEDKEDANKDIKMEQLLSMNKGENRNVEENQINGGADKDDMAVEDDANDGDADEVIAAREKGVAAARCDDARIINAALEDDDIAVEDDNEAVGDDDEAVEDDREAVSDNDEAVSDNDEAISDNDEAISDNDEAVDDQDASARNDDAAGGHNVLHRQSPHILLSPRMVVPGSNVDVDIGSLPVWRPYYQFRRRQDGIYLVARLHGTDSRNVRVQWNEQSSVLRITGFCLPTHKDIVMSRLSGAPTFGRFEIIEQFPPNVFNVQEATQQMFEDGTLQIYLPYYALRYPLRYRPASLLQAQDCFVW
ncbi:hypothetical protein CCR75_007799 [Bremia lactucae]|uniref:BAG domain-containing protein n=1 Tax=Bremia lactucae TaxID=4779 RepID=A0A976IL16_BRELC|nr:hypothetical protein CCR75_007799 [Bremia lactucae]